MIGHMFNPEDDLLVKDRLRPRWSPDGAVTFLTFRTSDSIPEQVVKAWERDKENWLARRGHTGAHWSTLVPGLPAEEQRLFLRIFNRCREDYLDGCHGQCWLRNDDVAQIVNDALLQFDGTHYRAGEFVIMPNHVHFLVAFPDQTTMKAQFESWVTLTTEQIRLVNAEAGELWHPDPFHNVVRSVEQYEWLVRYIADNPRKSGLHRGEYVYRQYRR
jgi:REP-associated tyrosine transposase